MTLNDAMRSKARLSITGSTGENGRVMTPEFPKAVHAVPYIDDVSKAEKEPEKWNKKMTHGTPQVYF
ncbi:unnamed protein product [Bubo scandiacus]